MHTPPRTALVTGGSGFLGSHVCERLRARGTRVVCVDNLLTGSAANIAHLRGPDFRWLRADVAELTEVDEPVDVVFHLASPASPRDYHRHPIATLRAGSVGTERALEIARAHGARFVLASTSEVYGDPAEHPQREPYRGNVNPVGPRSMYDEAKRYAEAFTVAHRAQYGTDTGIARIFNTYGPRLRAQDGRIVPTFVDQALRGEPLTVHGDGDQTRSLCYVDDTVEGLLRLAESSHPGPVNLGNDCERAVVEIAGLVRELTGTTSPVRQVPALGEDPRRRCPDISLAAQVLGWRPRVGLEEGLRRTIRAARAHQESQDHDGRARHAHEDRHDHDSHDHDSVEEPGTSPVAG